MGNGVYYNTCIAPGNEHTRSALRGNRHIRQTRNARDEVKELERAVTRKGLWISFWKGRLPKPSSASKQARMRMEMLQTIQNTVEMCLLLLYSCLSYHDRSQPTFPLPSW